MEDASTKSEGDALSRKVTRIVAHGWNGAVGERRFARRAERSEGSSVCRAQRLSARYARLCAHRLLRERGARYTNDGLAMTDRGQIEERR